MIHQSGLSFLSLLRWLSIFNFSKVEPTWLFILFIYLFAYLLSFLQEFKMVYPVLSFPIFSPPQLPLLGETQWTSTWASMLPGHHLNQHTTLSHPVTTHSSALKIQWSSKMV